MPSISKSIIVNVEANYIDIWVKKDLFVQKKKQGKN